MKRSLLVLAAVIGLSTPALANDGFNIDIGDPGTGSPDGTYGAGAGQAGFWNPINAGASGVTLFDLSGAASSVTITNTGGGGNFGFDNPGTTGNDQLLMDDLQDVGGAGASTNWRLDGLKNGEYLIYTYAWAPDSADFRASVDVFGSSDPAQLVGGAWPGSQAKGVTYALHTLDVTTNSISIDVTTIEGFASVNGLQIVYVPGPGALALLGLAGIARRRRR